MQLKISNISAPLEYTDAWLKEYTAKKLHISEKEIRSIKLCKKSVDARNKSNIVFVLCVIADITAKSYRNSRDVAVYKKEKAVSYIPCSSSKRPVIVGFGPAGMFAALYLAKCGMRPIVLERGLDVDSRLKKVELFHTIGILDENCNVQFGEGGAGTFSDGKLNTGVNDPLSTTVFYEFVAHGAPQEILYESKPHIGTDKLVETVKNIRKDIIKLGGEVLFGCKFTDFSEKEGILDSVTYEKDKTTYKIETDKLIVATGHSARDIFHLFSDKKFELEHKNFSIGVRIEHTQKELDESMYGNFASHPALNSADYKLSCHDETGRGIYSFCMCPGGSVVASSSEKNTIVTNGMSNFLRDGENANSAILVSVIKSDLDENDIFSGINLQKKIEEEAFIKAGSNYKAPAFLVGDFLNNNSFSGLGNVKPSYKPGVEFVNPMEYLPEFICSGLKFALPQFAKKISCFKNEKAIMTGPETRSSSPVRIIRNETLQTSKCKGIYPCGEGAGYAGGIVTAAMDGIRCAMSVCGR